MSEKFYGAQNEWEQLGDGWYVSSCGRFDARRDGKEWVLLRRHPDRTPTEVTRSIRLRDCQHRAERPMVALPLQVERERMFRLGLKYAGFMDRSIELAVAANRHVIEGEVVGP